MKKLLLAIMSVALFVSCCSVPQEVKDAFAADFPTASDAVWDCDDDSYEVSYVVDGVRYETEYDKMGNKIASDDPQPHACSHGHATCTGEHNHANCSGEHQGHNHGTCDGDHEHSDCKGEHNHDKAACTGNHENCSHK
ncbi:MAG: hypothetical protein IJ483_05695 [Flavobacteriales bacterium]|nr:hypothetical protein [Flavobacteriales bacterium]